jgi:apolipoprotein N-acyltransferase
MRKISGLSYPLLLSILSGLLLSLSWPARGIPLLIFVALVPLLLAEDHILKNRSKYNRYSVLLYAWLSFAVFNGLTTWWIFFASFPGVLMAVFLNSFFMAIPFALMHAARRILPGNQGVLSLLVFWLSFEYLHLDWDLSWSWLNLGNAFATLPMWVQWYEYTGTLGGTAWIIILNICFFSLYKAWSIPLEKISVQRNIAATDLSEKQKQEIFLKNMEQYRLVKKRAIMGLVTFFFLILPTGISLVIWNRYEMPEDPVEVIVVQPGRDPYMRPSTAMEANKWVDDMIALADPLITEETRFVVAPEAALPLSLWLHDKESHYGYSALKRHAMSFDSLTWVAGATMYRIYEPGDDLPPTADKLGETEKYYDAYNAALMVDSKGNTDQYFKSKLVPGIEQMPFAKYLRLLGKVVEYFGGTAGSMGKQDYRGVFEGADGTRVAPVICYESIYGAYINDYIKNGAELIFIITNDGWWRDTPGYKQHNQYARLRAIETRRSIARSAKTGISGFIDARGEMYEQTNWWEPSAVKLQIHKNDKLTFYVKTGDYLGRLSFFLTILLLLYMITQKLIKRKSGLGKI